MIIDLHKTGESTPKGCHGLSEGISSLRDLMVICIISYNSAIPSELKVGKASYMDFTSR